MPEIWTHPELGEFEHNGVAWLGQASAQTYSLFAAPGDDEDLPPGMVELAFVTYPHSEMDPPSDAHVQVMLELLANGKAIALKILDAVWADMQGTGPSTGMWWSSDLAAVNENAGWMMDEFETITDKASLLKSMELTNISIGHYHDPDAVDISFDAPWEDEHGVGVLIRNGEVAGIGYSHEPQPFE